MKAIQYTRHAKNRMRMHDISEAEITAVMEDADFTEPPVEGRINVWKEISGKFIRVTYKDESSRIMVITAVKKKKGWR
jgi:hypothetical protein